MVPGQKEDYVVVLDFLPNGYPFDNRPMHRKTAIAQAISKERFTLLELVPKKGVSLQPQQAVYIGEGKREDVHHVQGRIQGDKLTQTARLEMEHVVKQVVEEDQDRFVQFFNKAGPISTRRHQIELLPGIGKKHMWQIIDERRDKPM
jgi:putative nucleotide binding protein